MSSSPSARHTEHFYDVLSRLPDGAKNKGIRLKAGKIYRVRARQIDQEDLKVYAIEELLEKDVDDKELEELGKKALEPVQYIVDGIGEFTISREDQALLARGIVLHDNADGRNEISVIMECDHDNPTRADKSARMLHKIFDDIDTNERKIFSAIADDIADAEPMAAESVEDIKTAINKAIQDRDMIGKRYTPQTAFLF